MSRTLPSAISTGIAATVTTPGYLVEVGFPSPALPFRASSRGPVTWNGGVFVPYGMRLSGMGATTGQTSSSGSITFNDIENALGTMLLAYGLADITVSVWVFYGDPAPPDYTLASGDVLALFVGVASASNIDVSSGQVQLSAVQSVGGTLYGPRTYMTREAGFSFLPVPGTVIDWGGERFVLEADNG